MDLSNLPHGARAALAAALRAHGGALASPALTGPRAIAEITGAATSLVSRWVSIDHPEAPSIEAAALIETVSGVPHYARALAAMTGHRLVALADDEAPGVDPAAALHGIAACAHRFLADFHEALGDDELVPGECRTLLDDIGRLQTELSTIAAELARRVEG